MAAVRLALHVRTLPRRIRGARVTIRPLWSRRSEARTPSMAAPAPSGLTSGLPIFSGDRSGIVRLRRAGIASAQTHGRTMPRSRCRNRSARRQALGCDVTIVKLLVGGGLSPARVQIDTYDLFGAWARTFGKSRDQRPKQFRPRPVRQQRSRDMLVKAPLEVAFTILLHDEADVGRVQVGAQFEITAHACHVSRRCRMTLCWESHPRHDKYRAAKTSYSGWLAIFRQLGSLVFKESQDAVVG